MKQQLKLFILLVLDFIIMVAVVLGTAAIAPIITIYVLIKDFIQRRWEMWHSTQDIYN